MTKLKEIHIVIGKSDDKKVMVEILQMKKQMIFSSQHGEPIIDDEYLESIRQDITAHLLTNNPYYETSHHDGFCTPTTMNIISFLLDTHDSDPLFNEVTIMQAATKNHTFVMLFFPKDPNNPILIDGTYQQFFYHQLTPEGKHELLAKNIPMVFVGSIKQFVDLISSKWLTDQLEKVQSSYKPILLDQKDQKLREQQLASYYKFLQDRVFNFNIFKKIYKIYSAGQLDVLQDIDPLVRIGTMEEREQLQNQLKSDYEAKNQELEKLRQSSQLPHEKDEKITNLENDMIKLEVLLFYIGGAPEMLPCFHKIIPKKMGNSSHPSTYS